MTDTLCSIPLTYSKEFLLQYSGIQKRDPCIVDKLTPLISPPKSKRNQRNDKKWTPDNNTPHKTRTPNSTKGLSLMNSSSPPFQQPKQHKNNSKNSKSAQKHNSNVVFQQRDNPVLLSSSSPFPTPTKVNSTILSTPNYRVNDTPENSSSLQDIPKFSIDYVYSTPVNSPSRLPKQHSTPMIKTSPVKQQESPSTPNSKTMITPLPSPSKNTNSSSPKSPFRSPPRPISPLDEQRLLQRQKQIDYGYRTVGYLRYRLLVTKEQRRPEHPRTPKKNQGCSKRSWDGQLKKWRRDLHLWDPDSIEAFRAVLDSELVLNIVKTNPELDEIVKIVKEKMDNPDGNFDENENDTSNSSPDKQENDDDENEKEEDSTPPKISSDPRLHKVARTLVF